MKTRKIVYSHTARADLINLLHWLAQTASVSAAVEIIDDIESFIARLDIAAERGISRDDLEPGLRIIARRRADIAVLVDEKTVTITRIFYGGQDWQTALKPKR